jgi:hypothetical protein
MAVPFNNNTQFTIIKNEAAHIPVEKFDISKMPKFE